MDKFKRLTKQQRQDIYKDFDKGSVAFAQDTLKLPNAQLRSLIYEHGLTKWQQKLLERSQTNG